MTNFHGPETADLANVASLNAAFMALLRRHEGLPGSSTSNVAELARRLQALPVARAERLAECPFLLFAFDESRLQAWQHLFDGQDDGDTDMIDQLQRPPQSVLQMTAAGLGFLWELSRRNPYAARLVSGASLNWCEQIADCSPVHIMRFVVREPYVLALRMATKRAFWSKLLGAGTSEEGEIRGAAQLSALQFILTRPAEDHYARLQTAACRMTVPATRVAERGSSPAASQEQNRSLKGQ